MTRSYCQFSASCPVARRAWASHLQSKHPRTGRTFSRPSPVWFYLLFFQPIKIGIMAPSVGQWHLRGTVPSSQTCDPTQTVLRSMYITRCSPKLWHASPLHKIIVSFAKITVGSGPPDPAQSHRLTVLLPH